MNPNGNGVPLHTAAAPAASLAPTAGGFGIYVDPQTTTTAVGPNPSNQAIQGNVLANRTNNPTYQPRLHLANQAPMPMNYYWQQHTAPGDPRTVQQLQQQNPAAYQAALNTSYRPQGVAAGVVQSPLGVSVHGEWHAGYLQQVYANQSGRSNPDVNPLWSQRVLVQADQTYRASPYIVPGIQYPTPSVGMATYQPMLQSVQRGGFQVCNVDQRGYVQWIWQGNQ